MLSLLRRTDDKHFTVPSQLLSATRASVAALVLLAPVLGIAQDDAVTGTADMAETVREAYRVLDGQEVRVEGAVGMFAGRLLYFVDETGRYSLKLDAGRDIRRQIEACEVNPYDFANSPCQVVGMAEVSAGVDDDDVADGINIELVLYSVESLETGSE